MPYKGLIMTQITNEPNPNKATDNKQPSKPKIHWVFLLLLLLIAIGFGLAAFQLLNFQKKLLSSSQQIHYLNLALQQQMQDTNNNKTTILRLSQKLNQSKEAWMLPEIKTLIWRANIILTLEHNTPIAIDLLKMADTYLAQLHDTALLNLRKILTSDIAKLQALPQLDITKIYLRLQALSNQIKQLPLIDTDATKNQPAVQKKPTTKETQPVWKRFFTGTWDTISTFLVIRHHQQPVQPLLTAQQHQIVITKLQILCAQAQWAVLQHHNKIYHSILQQIQQTVKNSFLQNSRYTKMVLDELSALQKINIDLAPPSLDNALQEMKKLTPNRTNTKK
ncbi:MAG: uroporphyrinogen-III C-methyltransferase [Gammaproteobacteria bacterium]|jgi:uroporphyrin-3 C-methyltransferase